MMRVMEWHWRLWLLMCMMMTAVPVHAAISVRDDAGNLVVLPKPAQRVISMAPHATELLFAAGGGDRIVGAVDYSDYPEAAKRIPRVGDNHQVDMEKIVAMHPDLIVVWPHISSERQIERLRELGTPFFYSEPHKLQDIPDSIVRLGQLLGTEQAARQSASELRQKLAALEARYAHRPTVRLFYQVWDKPLYTLNGQHIVSDAIRLCGGENIFADLKIAAPAVSIEAVLQEDPEAIFATAERGPGGGIGMWKPYTTMTAVRRGNLMTIDGSLLNRAGPRMIAGTAALCEKLEQVRSHRIDAQRGQP
jgi:iron complex transport system substrate-binding protein